MVWNQISRMQFPALRRYCSGTGLESPQPQFQYGPQRPISVIHHVYLGMLRNRPSAGRRPTFPVNQLAYAFLANEILGPGLGDVFNIGCNELPSGEAQQTFVCPPDRHHDIVVRKLATEIYPLIFRWI